MWADQEYQKSSISQSERKSIECSEIDQINLFDDRLIGSNKHLTNITLNQNNIKFPPVAEESIDFHLLLNIGGSHFRIRSKTIQYRCPVSFLAQFCSLTHAERLGHCDGFLAATEEYFFERSGRIFDIIYDFFTTGHLHYRTGVCFDRLMKELDFWQIKKSFFAPCCVPLSEISDEEDEKGYITSIQYGDQFDSVCFSTQRRKIWAILEDPSSGYRAKGFAIISITMVIVSVTGMILGSLPELQVTESGRDSRSAPLTKFKAHMFLEYLEILCVAWFTFEYLLRFAICTNKCQFIIGPLNLIDSLTIVPFYMEVLFDSVGVDINRMNDVRGLAMVMRVVRVMRVARIFKLARYSSGLKSFGLTVKTSLAELSMLFLFLLTAVIFFSTLMYFAERDEPHTKFRSIAHAGWWCIVTMTTVGYGDFCPQTFAGKIIASCASISGVLVLAFPITMIVENFSKAYDTGKSELKTVQRRRRLARAYN